VPIENKRMEGEYNEPMIINTKIWVFLLVYFFSLAGESQAIPPSILLQSSLLQFKKKMALIMSLMLSFNLLKCPFKVDRANVSTPQRFLDIRFK
jgi:hypothetical protein